MITVCRDNRTENCGQNTSYVKSKSGDKVIIVLGFEFLLQYSTYIVRSCDLDCSVQLHWTAFSSSHCCELRTVTENDCKYIARRIWIWLMKNFSYLGVVYSCNIQLSYDKKCSWFVFEIFSFWAVIYLLKPSSFQRNDQKNYLLFNQDLCYSHGCRRAFHSPIWCLLIPSCSKI
jgi:hypothetical protein